MGHLRCEGGIGVPFLLTNIENDWGPKANADQSGGERGSSETDLHF